MYGNFDGAGYTQVNQTGNILTLMEPILLWEKIDKSHIWYYVVMMPWLSGDSGNVIWQRQNTLTEGLPDSAAQPGWSSG